MKNNILLLIIILLPIFANSQKFTGRVMIACMQSDNQHNHTHEPLSGALVYINNTTLATTTDANGYFTIELPSENSTIIIKMLGYKTDTLVFNHSKIQREIFLQPENKEIEQILVTGTNNGQFTNSNSEQLVKTITATGLKKLPCCNLSESFENNADVDVSYTDAVSGAKQIQMLGLAGKYTQILVENIPSFSGLSQIYGLSHLPGSWMQSIQVSKGIASAINGLEAIAGQINVELKKPDTNEPLFINFFTNSDLRTEVNFNSSLFLTKDFGTTLFAHASVFPKALDVNKDSFTDEPIAKQFNFLNRWIYQTPHFGFQLGLKFLYEDRQGGQMNYLTSLDTSKYYAIDINQKKYEVFIKIGAPLDFLLNDFSVGSTFLLTKNDFNSTYGKNVVNAAENNLYGNIIFEKHIFNEKNKINFGTNINYGFIELMGNSLTGYNIPSSFYYPSVSNNYIGFYTQYNFTTDKFSAILGYRYDKILNLEDPYFHTLRIHMRYKVAKNTTIRASAGNGFNKYYPYIQNINLMASNRRIKTDPYVFYPYEKAWNFGASFTQDIYLGFRKFGSFTIDAFRTYFTQQVIVDLDQSPQEIYFYNLNGISYSNSFQVEFSCEPFRWLSLSSAFKYNDVKQTIGDVLREKPFINKYRGLLSLYFTSSNKKWFLDITNQLNGPARIPSTASNPIEYRRVEYSPVFYILHFQVTYKTKKLELYTGCENATNYLQNNPIIASDNPFGQYFDASMIWGPLMGRKIYAGLRFKL